jgi:hypothetical protein
MSRAAEETIKKARKLGDRGAPNRSSRVLAYRFACGSWRAHRYLDRSGRDRQNDPGLRDRTAGSTNQCVSV